MVLEEPNLEIPVETDPQQADLDNLAALSLTDEESAKVLEIQAMIDEMAALQYQSNYFRMFQQYYIDTLNLKMAGIELDLVVYDEVEYFRHYRHP